MSIVKDSCAIDRATTSVMGRESKIGSVGSKSRIAACTLLVTARGSPPVLTTSAMVRDKLTATVSTDLVSGKYTVGDGAAISDVSRMSPTTPTTVNHGPLGKVWNRRPMARPPVVSCQK